MPAQSRGASIAARAREVERGLRRAASRRGGGGARPWASPGPGGGAAGRSGSRGSFAWRHAGSPCPDATIPRACPPSSSPGAAGFVGSWTRPGPARTPDHRVVALVRTPIAGELVLGRLPAAWRDRGRAAHRRRHPAAVARPALIEQVDAVVHLVAIPRDFNGGAELRLVNTEGTRAVVAAMAAAGVRRLVHMGALGVEDDPTLHYASSKAKAEAHRARIGPRLDDPQAVAPVRGGGRLLQHRRRPRPPVTRDRARSRASGKSRFQPIHAGDVARVVVRCPRRPDDLGAGVRARRAALLDLPGDHPGGPRGARQAPPDRADAGAADLAGRRARGASSTCRSRSPPTSSASCGSTTSGRSTCHPAALRLRAAADGGRPRLPAGEAARPAHPWRPRRTARTDRRLRRIPRVSDRSGRVLGVVAWLVAVVAIALGAAGLAVAMPAEPGTARPAPSSPRRATASWRRSWMPPSGSAASLGHGLEALGTQARGALAAMVGAETQTMDTAIAEGDRLIEQVRVASAAIRTELAAMPFVGTPAAAADGLRGPPSALRVAAARGGGGRRAGSPVGAAADRRRRGGPARGPAGGARPACRRRRGTGPRREIRGGDQDHRLGRRPCWRSARTSRDRLANSVDVSVLDQWIERNASYDAALRALYTAEAEGRRQGHAPAEGRDRRGEGRAGPAPAEHPRARGHHVRHRPGRDERRGDRHRGGPRGPRRRARAGVVGVTRPDPRRRYTAPHLTTPSPTLSATAPTFRRSARPCKSVSSPTSRGTSRRRPRHPDRGRSGLRRATR